jgi:hypothetical protein
MFFSYALEDSDETIFLVNCGRCCKESTSQAVIYALGFECKDLCKKKGIPAPLMVVFSEEHFTLKGG